MSPIVLRWFGVEQLTWAYYDRGGYLVREVVPEEVPTARLGPVMPVTGGYVMSDPQGGTYLARWPTAIH